MTNLHYGFMVSLHHFTEIVQAVRDAGGEVTADTMTLDGLTAGYLYLPGKIVLTFEPKAADNAKYPDWVDGKPAEPALVKLIEEHRGKPVAAVWPPVPPQEAVDASVLVPEAGPVVVESEEKRGFWGGFRKGE